MITLETFKKCINAIQYQDKIDEQLTALLVDKECTGWITTGEKLVNAMRALLKDAMNDQYNYIDWWLYDVEEGERKVWERKKVQSPVQNLLFEYNLDSLGDLYNYILGKYDDIPVVIKPDVPEENEGEYNTCSVDDFFEQAGMLFDKTDEVKDSD